jgi:hypothetical protein
MSATGAAVRMSAARKLLFASLQARSKERRPGGQFG